VKRRDFLKALAGGAAVAAVPALAKSNTSNNTGVWHGQFDEVPESGSYFLKHNEVILSPGDIISFENDDTLYRVVRTSESIDEYNSEVIPYDPDIYKL